MEEKLPFRTILDFIDIPSIKHPSKTALVFNNQEFTYSNLKQRIDTTAKHIIKKTRPQNIVAILLPNSPEFITAYFAVLRAKCIALLIPPNISDHGLIYQLTKTRPKILISNDVYKEKFDRCNTPKLSRYVDVSDFSILLDTKVIMPKINAGNYSTIIFTSGTTSLPKGALLTHKNVVNATKNITQFLKWTEKDTDINISPLTHSFGLGHIHCSFASCGTTILFRDSINIKSILKTIAQKKATSLGLVPAVLRVLVQYYPEQLKRCGHFLRFIQTNQSSLEPQLIKRVFKITPNTDFCYYYGLTEASRATFINFRRNPDKIESVGRASPNVKVRIVDSRNRALPINSVGQICVRGKMVIKKYWKNPQASKCFNNGWMFTGDAGYIDQRGFVYFKGRMDDIINVAGEKVSPEEIENIVKKIEGITDAATIGIPDPILGQAIKLFIVSPKKIKNEKIINYLRCRLESYKIPKEIQTIDEIPKTENGKIKRIVLREMCL